MGFAAWAGHARSIKLSAVVPIAERWWLARCRPGCAFVEAGFRDKSSARGTTDICAAVSFISLYPRHAICMHGGVVVICLPGVLVERFDLLLPVAHVVGLDEEMGLEGAHEQIGVERIQLAALQEPPETDNSIGLSMVVSRVSATKEAAKGSPTISESRVW